jgi:hypothetical protein
VAAFIPALRAWTYSRTFTPSDNGGGNFGRTITATRPNGATATSSFNRRVTNWTITDSRAITGFNGATSTGTVAKTGPNGHSVTETRPRAKTRHLVLGGKVSTFETCSPICTSPGRRSFGGLLGLKPALDGDESRHTAIADTGTRPSALEKTPASYIAAYAPDAGAHAPAARNGCARTRAYGRDSQQPCRYLIPSEPGRRVHRALRRCAPLVRGWTAGKRGKNFIGGHALDRPRVTILASTTKIRSEQCPKALCARRAFEVGCSSPADQVYQNFILITAPVLTRSI